MQKVVHTKQELLDVIQENREGILQLGVLKIGIFGSFVRDEANEESDVDFFVEMPNERKTLSNFMNLYDYLENMTGRKVDIVTPQSLNKFTGKYILKEVEYVTFAA